MALVKYGGGIVSMSGKLAGNVHARNKGGDYIRSWKNPTNPNTARQITVRAALAFLADRWAQTLTAANRTAWNLYGTNVAMENRLGDVIHLSGYNHYIRSNLIRKAFGLAVIDAGPVIFEVPAQDPTYAITCTEAGQTISIVFDNTMDWADEDGAFMVGFQGTPQNAQRNFFAGPWKSFSVISGVNGAPPASPQIVAVATVITELQHQWTYARILRADGRLSERFRADTFCAA